MGLINIIIIAIGLAMDSFTISLGIGTAGRIRNVRPIFRVSYHLGLFQGLFTVFGWLAGSGMARYIARYDHWVAMLLLAYVGVKMIRSGINPEEKMYEIDPTRGKMLVLLSAACSIDALAVGLSFGMLNMDVLLPSIVIGLVSVIFSLVGLYAGHRLGVRFGKRMEVLGGLLLIGIGGQILITHLFG